MKIPRVQVFQLLKPLLQPHIIGPEDRNEALTRLGADEKLEPSEGTIEFVECGEEISLTRCLQIDDEKDPSNAALNTMAYLLKGEKGFISHICKLPQAGNVESESQVPTGQASLVYSLTSQLLDWKDAEDEFMFEESKLENLIENQDGWQVALSLLRTLIEHTPTVRYCIIDGVQKLEQDATSVNRYKELLDVLMTSYRGRKANFSVLFTIHGPAPVLFDKIQETPDIGRLYREASEIPGPSIKKSTG